MLGGRPRGQPEAASHGGAGRLGSLVSQASYQQARRRGLSHSELGELRVAYAWLRIAFQQGGAGREARAQSRLGG